MKRAKPTPRQSASRDSQPRQTEAVPNRFLVCPGSGIGHEQQVYLPLLQGPKIRFLRCPYPRCQVKVFLRGPAWGGDEVGATAESIRRRNPAAVILE